MESTAAGPPGRPGCYLLVVVSEPLSVDHKERILQKVAKGLLSWDVASTGSDLTDAEEAFRKLQREKNAKELLIQHSTERVAVEVLFNPQLNTLKQCLRNLLASNTCHKHLIHAGYAFTGSGSWILFDGIFGFQDLLDAFQHADVQRSLQSQARSTVHVHCTAEGEWTSANVEQETLTKVADISLNPPDKVSCVAGGSSLIDCLDAVLVTRRLEEKMTSSSIVGSIRFNRPSLYIFPGGQGDCALFGVNGFTMLIDGGFNKIPCFWEFIRHLDRLDALMITRLNETNLCGISSLVKRKTLNNMYPQIGYVFCNVAEGKLSPSDEMLKDRDELLLSVINVGHEFLENLYQIGLKPHLCLREPVLDPLILYHKVGHGTLEMYILGPPKDSRELRDFLHQWSTNKENFTLVRMGSKSQDQEVPIPLSHAMSICSLIVWRPAEPKDTITRILFPGSAPQNKILEGLEKLKNSDFLKQPVCTQSSLQTTVIGKIKTKPDTDQVIQKAMSGRAAATPSPVPIGRKPAKSEESIASKKSSVEDVRIKPATVKTTGKRSGSRKASEGKKDKKTENKDIKSTTPHILKSKETKVNGHITKGTEKPETVSTKPDVPEARTKGIKELNNKKAVEAKIASRKSESLKSKRPATPPKSPLKQVKSKSPASSPKHEPKVKERAKAPSKPTKISKRHEAKAATVEGAEEKSEKPKARKVKRDASKLKEAPSSTAEKEPAVPRKPKEELAKIPKEIVPDLNKVSEEIKEKKEAEKAEEALKEADIKESEPEIIKEEITQRPEKEPEEIKEEEHVEEKEPEIIEVEKESKEPSPTLVDEEKKVQELELKAAEEKHVEAKPIEAEPKLGIQEPEVQEVHIEPEGPSKEHLESEGVTGEEISEIETEEMSPEMEGEKNEILQEEEEIEKALPALEKEEKLDIEEKAYPEEEEGVEETKEQKEPEHVEIMDEKMDISKEPVEKMDEVKPVSVEIEESAPEENVMSLQKEIEEFERQHLPELAQDTDEKAKLREPSQYAASEEEEEEFGKEEEEEEMEVEEEEKEKEKETLKAKGEITTIETKISSETKPKLEEEKVDTSPKELEKEKKETDDKEEMELLGEEEYKEEVEKEVKEEKAIEKDLTEDKPDTTFAKEISQEAPVITDESKPKLKDVGRIEELKTFKSMESSGSEETEITESEKTVQETEPREVEALSSEPTTEIDSKDMLKEKPTEELEAKEIPPTTVVEVSETAIEKSEDELIKDDEGKKIDAKIPTEHVAIPAKEPSKEAEKEKDEEEYVSSEESEGHEAIEDLTRAKETKLPAEVVDKVREEPVHVEPKLEEAPAKPAQETEKEKPGKGDIEEKVVTDIQQLEKETVPEKLPETTEAPPIVPMTKAAEPAPIPVTTAELTKESIEEKAVSEVKTIEKEPAKISEIKSTELKEDDKVDEEKTYDAVDRAEVTEPKIEKHEIAVKEAAPTEVKTASKDLVEPEIKREEIKEVKQDVEPIATTEQREEEEEVEEEEEEEDEAKAALLGKELSDHEYEKDVMEKDIDHKGSGAESSEYESEGSKEEEDEEEMSSEEISPDERESPDDNFLKEKDQLETTKERKEDVEEEECAIQYKALEKEDEYSSEEREEEEEEELEDGELVLHERKPSVIAAKIDEKTVNKAEKEAERMILSYEKTEHEDKITLASKEASESEEEPEVDKVGFEAPLISKVDEKAITIESKPEQEITVADVAVEHDITEASEEQDYLIDKFKSLSAKEKEPYPAVDSGFTSLEKEASLPEKVITELDEHLLTKEPGVSIPYGIPEEGTVPAKPLGIAEKVDIADQVIKTLKAEEDKKLEEATALSSEKSSIHEEDYEMIEDEVVLSDKKKFPQDVVEEIVGTSEIKLAGMVSEELKPMDLMDSSDVDVTKEKKITPEKEMKVDQISSAVPEVSKETIAKDVSDKMPDISKVKIEEEKPKEETNLTDKEPAKEEIKESVLPTDKVVEKEIGLVPEKSEELNLEAVAPERKESIPKEAEGTEVKQKIEEAKSPGDVTKLEKIAKQEEILLKPEKLIAKELLLSSEEEGEEEEEYEEEEEEEEEEYKMDEKGPAYEETKFVDQKPDILSKVAKPVPEKPELSEKDLEVVKSLDAEIKAIETDTKPVVEADKKTELPEKTKEEVLSDKKETNDEAKLIADKDEKKPKELPEKIDLEKPGEALKPTQEPSEEKEREKQEKEVPSAVPIPKVDLAKKEEIPEKTEQISEDLGIATTHIDEVSIEQKDISEEGTSETQETISTRYDTGTPSDKRYDTQSPLPSDRSDSLIDKDILRETLPSEELKPVDSKDKSVKESISPVPSTELELRSITPESMVSDEGVEPTEKGLKPYEDEGKPHDVSPIDDEEYSSECESVEEPKLEVKPTTELKTKEQPEPQELSKTKAESVSVLDQVKLEMHEKGIERPALASEEEPVLSVERDVESKLHIEKVDAVPETKRVEIPAVDKMIDDKKEFATEKKILAEVSPVEPPKAEVLADVEEQGEPDKEPPPMIEKLREQEPAMSLVSSGKTVEEKETVKEPEPKITAAEKKDGSPKSPTLLDDAKEPSHIAEPEPEGKPSKVIAESEPEKVTTIERGKELSKETALPQAAQQVSDVSEVKETKEIPDEKKPISAISFEKESVEPSKITPEQFKEKVATEPEKAISEVPSEKEVIEPSTEKEKDLTKPSVEEDSKEMSKPDGKTALEKETEKERSKEIPGEKKFVETTTGKEMDEKKPLQSEVSKELPKTEKEVTEPEKPALKKEEQKELISEAPEVPSDKHGIESTTKDEEAEDIKPHLEKVDKEQPQIEKETTEPVKPSLEKELGAEPTKAAPEILEDKQIIEQVTIKEAEATIKPPLEEVSKEVPKQEEKAVAPVEEVLTKEPGKESTEVVPETLGDKQIAEPALKKEDEVIKPAPEVSKETPDQEIKEPSKPIQEMETEKEPEGPPQPIPETTGKEIISKEFDLETEKEKTEPPPSISDKETVKEPEKLVDKTKGVKEVAKTPKLVAEVTASLKETLSDKEIPDTAEPTTEDKLKMATEEIQKEAHEVPSSTEFEGDLKLELDKIAAEIKGFKDEINDIREIKDVHGPTEISLETDTKELVCNEPAEEIPEPVKPTEEIFKPTDTVLGKEPTTIPAQVSEKELETTKEHEHPEVISEKLTEKEIAKSLEVTSEILSDKTVTETQPAVEKSDEAKGKEPTSTESIKEAVKPELMEELKSLPKDAATAKPLDDIKVDKKPEKPEKETLEHTLKKQILPTDEYVIETTHDEEFTESVTKTEIDTSIEKEHKEITKPISEAQKESEEPTKLVTETMKEKDAISKPVTESEKDSSLEAEVLKPEPHKLVTEEATEKEQLSKATEKVEKFALEPQKFETLKDLDKHVEEGHTIETELTVKSADTSIKETPIPESLELKLAEKVSEKDVITEPSKIPETVDLTSDETRVESKEPEQSKSGADVKAEKEKLSKVSEIKVDELPEKTKEKEAEEPTAKVSETTDDKSKHEPEIPSEKEDKATPSTISDADLSEEKDFPDKVAKEDMKASSDKISEAPVSTEIPSPPKAVEKEPEITKESVPELSSKITPGLSGEEKEVPSSSTDDTKHDVIIKEKVDIVGSKPSVPPEHSLPKEPLLGTKDVDERTTPSPRPTEESDVESEIKVVSGLKPEAVSETYSYSEDEMSDISGKHSPAIRDTTGQDIEDRLSEKTSPLMKDVTEIVSDEKESYSSKDTKIMEQTYDISKPTDSLSENLDSLLPDDDAEVSTGTGSMTEETKLTEASVPEVKKSDIPSKEIKEESELPITEAAGKPQEADTIKKICETTAIDKKEEFKEEVIPMPLKQVPVESKPVETSKTEEKAATPDLSELKPDKDLKDVSPEAVSEDSSQRKDSVMSEASGAGALYEASKAAALHDDDAEKSSDIQKLKESVEEDHKEVSHKAPEDDSSQRKESIKPDVGDTGSVSSILHEAPPGTDSQDDDAAKLGDILKLKESFEKEHKEVPAGTSSGESILRKESIKAEVPESGAVGYALYEALQCVDPFEDVAAKSDVIQKLKESVEEKQKEIPSETSMEDSGQRKESIKPDVGGIGSVSSILHEASQPTDSQDDVTTKSGDILKLKESVEEEHKEVPSGTSSGDSLLRKESVKSEISESSAVGYALYEALQCVDPLEDVTAKSDVIQKLKESVEEEQNEILSESSDHRKESIKLDIGDAGSVSPILHEAPQPTDLQDDVATKSGDILKLKESVEEEHKEVPSEASLEDSSERKESLKAEASDTGAVAYALYEALQCVDPFEDVAAKSDVIQKLKESTEICATDSILKHPAVRRESLTEVTQEDTKIDKPQEKEAAVPKTTDIPADKAKDSSLADDKMKEPSTEQAPSKTDKASDKLHDLKEPIIGDKTHDDHGEEHEAKQAAAPLESDIKAADSKPSKRHDMEPTFSRETSMSSDGVEDSSVKEVIGDSATERISHLDEVEDQLYQDDRESFPVEEPGITKKDRVGEFEYTDDKEQDDKEEKHTSSGKLPTKDQKETGPSRSSEPIIRLTPAMTTSIITETMMESFEDHDSTYSGFKGDMTRIKISDLDEEETDGTSDKDYTYGDEDDTVGKDRCKDKDSEIVICEGFKQHTIYDVQSSEYDSDDLRDDYHSPKTLVGEPSSIKQSKDDENAKRLAEMKSPEPSISPASTMSASALDEAGKYFADESIISSKLDEVSDLSREKRDAISPKSDDTASSRKSERDDGIFTSDMSMTGSLYIPETSTQEYSEEESLQEESHSSVIGAKDMKKETSDSSQLPRVESDGKKDESVKKQVTSSLSDSKKPDAESSASPRAASPGGLPVDKAAHGGKVPDSAPDALTQSFYGSSCSEPDVKSPASYGSSESLSQDGGQSPDDSDAQGEYDADEEMVRHPTPPGAENFYEHIGPTSLLNTCTSTLAYSTEVIEQPLYEEAEDEHEEEEMKEMVDQPVYGKTLKADYPEFVTLSGGTTPSEPQSPKTPLDVKRIASAQSSGDLGESTISPQRMTTALKESTLESSAEAPLYSVEIGPDGKETVVKEIVQEIRTETVTSTFSEEIEEVDVSETYETTMTTTTILCKDGEEAVQEVKTDVSVKDVSTHESKKDTASSSSAVYEDTSKVIQQLPSSKVNGECFVTTEQVLESKQVTEDRHEQRESSLSSSKYLSEYVCTDVATDSSNGFADSSQDHYHFRKHGEAFGTSTNGDHVPKTSEKTLYSTEVMEQSVHEDKDYKSELFEQCFRTEVSKTTDCMQTSMYGSLSPDEDDDEQLDQVMYSSTVLDDDTPQAGLVSYKPITSTDDKYSTVSKTYTVDTRSVEDSMKKYETEFQSTCFGGDSAAPPEKIVTFSEQVSTSSEDRVSSQESYDLSRKSTRRGSETNFYVLEESSSFLESDHKATSVPPEYHRESSSEFSGHAPGTSTSSAAPGTKKEFNVDDWGEPMGLPSPPDPVQLTTHTTKKTVKKSSTAMKSLLAKTADERNKSSTDSGKSALGSTKSNPLSSGKAATKSKTGSSGDSGRPVFVDLTYVPHHADSQYCNVSFFKRVRARYYVFSSVSPSKEVLDALLEAKKSWENKEAQVTIIPTYESDTLGYWIANNMDSLAEYKIDIAPSASRCTINLQDHESSCAAYRLEF